ncbi:hypothetical protein MBLNU457_1657t2 [Dothideomycetes sp. NU457]
MLVTRTASPLRIGRVHFQCLRDFSSTAAARKLQLAYDHYTAAEGATTKNAPIVFIHGLFGSKKNNRSMSKVFARDLKRDVYAIDTRNHGDSPHDPTHNYTVLAQDIEDFITTHSLPSPVLIGHSMGAKAAMTVGLRNRVPISALVSVDNAPVDAALKSDFAAYVRGMNAITAAKVTKQSEADAILAEYEPSLPIRQFLLTNLARDKSDGVQKWRVPVKTLGNALDHMADFPFKDPEDARFEGRTLFVRGTKSHYVSDEALPVIGRFFPKFTVVDVECGHWIISEKPEEFRRAVVDFLQDTD